MLPEQEKENLIKELNKLRGRLKENIGHLRKLRKEIKYPLNAWRGSADCPEKRTQK